MSSSAAYDYDDEDTAGWSAILKVVGLTLTVLTIALLAGGAQVFERHVRTARRRNRARRRALIRKLGLPPAYASGPASSPRGPADAAGAASATSVPAAQPRVASAAAVAAAPAPSPSADGYLVVGFLHPYANAGGGGERVLFHALDWVVREHPNAVCVVYTGDIHPDQGLGSPFSSSSLGAILHAVPSARATAVSIAEAGAAAPRTLTAPDGAPYVDGPAILAQAQRRFGLDLPANRVYFLPVKSRHLLGDSWRCFTLAGQALGGALVASEAMAQVMPDMLIDTTGLAFAAPMARAYDARLPIASYTHYPAITRTMLARVASRTPGHTNSVAVARSYWRSALKLLYYRIFALFYVRALHSPDALTANGTWTTAQLRALFSPRAYDLASQLVPHTPPRPDTAASPPTNDAQPRKGKEVARVYPPVDVAALEVAPLNPAGGRTGIVSLAQFRPEKEHATQLRALAALRALQERISADVDVEGDKTQPRAAPLPMPKLTMIGGVRNAEDERRVWALRQYAEQLGVADHVEFVVNAPWTQVVDILAHASVGFSTMVDEHFGMGVVEFMVRPPARS